MTDGADIAVIGAGCVGLATAEALAERGEVVAVYESGSPGQGMSAGSGRVFRHAHEDPRLVRIAAESRALWRELSERYGEELISPDGVLALGEGALAKLAVLEGQNVPARRIGSEEIAERHPLLASYEGEAAFDETGGSIRTEAFVRLLSARLSDSLVSQEVLSVRPVGAGIEVRVPGHSATYERVVLCAGRGTKGLARGAGVEIPLQPGVHVRSTFRVVADPPERVAALLDSAGEWGETGVYAAAAPGNERYSIGLAETMEVREDGSVVDPARFSALEERVIDYVRRALPGLDPEPAELLHCWATELPWHEDAFAIWEQDGLFVTGGHNLWKMAPALGAALAAAAVGEGVREDMRPEARLGPA